MYKTHFQPKPYTCSYKENENVDLSVTICSSFIYSKKVSYFDYPIAFHRLRLVHGSTKSDHGLRRLIEEDKLKSCNLHQFDCGFCHKQTGRHRTQEQDKSSYIEQQPSFSDRNVSKAQPKKRGGVTKPTGASYHFGKYEAVHPTAGKAHKFKFSFKPHFNRYILVTFF